MLETLEQRKIRQDNQDLVYLVHVQNSCTDRNVMTRVSGSIAMKRNEIRKRIFKNKVKN